MSAKEVLEIFESIYEEQVHDRKARAITMFLDERPDGFYYNELADITQISHYVLKDMAQGFTKEMKGPFIDILSKARQGFKKQKIFDDRLKFEDISRFLNVFVPILYDFQSLIDKDDTFEEIKISQKDITEIKFNVIYFLYYFLKEDVDRARESHLYRKKMQKEKTLKKTLKGGASFLKKSQPTKTNEDEEKKYEEFKKNYINENLKTEGTKNFRALNNSDLPEGLVYFLQHNSSNMEL